MKRSHNHRNIKLLPVIRKFIKEGGFLIESDEEKNKRQIKNFMYNGYNIMIEYKYDVFLAVVYTGSSNKKLRSGIRKILDDVHEIYSRENLSREVSMDELEDIELLMDSLIDFNKF